MSKGIIYLMTTAVPGLVKIGKTGSKNYDQRMNELEHNGYRNVTALKREFAIEVDDYDEKEKLLHTIFEKSQLSDTELFAIDVNIAKQLLSSFEGRMIFPDPNSETKNEVFGEAVDRSKGKLIPDGKYTLKKNKKSDHRVVKATAIIKNGSGIIKKGSIVGISEDVGVSKKAQEARKNMLIDTDGNLLEDYELGESTPSFASDVVVNGCTNGWEDWKNSKGNAVNIYRSKEGEN